MQKRCETKIIGQVVRIALNEKAPRFATKGPFNYKKRLYTRNLLAP
jgi:hypothetical protein